MNNTTKVSIVLGSYNRKAFLKAAIASIRQNGMAFPYEIIVVDGGSTDGTIQWLTKQKDIITIVQHNRGEWNGKQIQRRSWGYFINLGFKCARGKYVCMLSDDCLVVPGAIRNGYELFERESAQGKNVGAVAFYWRNWPEQKDYWVGLTLGEKMFVNHGIYLRAALADVGWIDEASYQFYYADGDLCLKLWQHGYEVVDCPTAFVEHFAHANPVARRGNLESERTDWEAYLEKWRGVFYHPDRPNQRDWVYLAYEDPRQTTNRFPNPHGTLRSFRGLFDTLKSANPIRKLWPW